MVIAREGQACAHAPHPIHLEKSICPVSVSVAPVGQTNKHKQSLVHNFIFLYGEKK